ncbi:hypothetical protein B0T21DRAFT_164297 [Apiosordaria backusii]|uniref:PARP catalytic domain-containing protein n=1 Tax=Apiosordaria backusii TaxID=314023 RepID=A0AA40BND9_9PEZI|nr:hypothetical protein B0T21DRAFT_164297 [Apiosordaria backusii]
MFKEGWLHPETVPLVTAIYLASKSELQNSFRGKRFDKWRKKYGNGKFVERFHGTTRLCKVGDSGSELWRCGQAGCYLCSILRTSFDVGKANSKGMFGKGIYTTRASSTNIYTNSNTLSENRAILICRVVANRPERLSKADNEKNGVRAGFNSVEGLTKSDGGGLNYPETVVYWNNAIVPVGLVVYRERSTWQAIKATVGQLLDS